MAAKKEILKIVDEFSKKKILVIGDLMLDKYIWGAVERISPEAPVQVVTVKKETYAPGGAANVAMNLTSLSGKTYLVGIVGKDESNKKLISILKKKGIATEGILVDSKKPTIQKIRIIGHNQQLLRVDYEDKEYINSDDEKKVLKYVNSIIKEVDAIIISDYTKGIITKSLMQEIIKKAKENNKKIIVDPKPKHTEFYKTADLVTPNNNEACEMLGIEAKNHNLNEIGTELAKKLNTTVLITRGEKGMTLFEEKKATDIPTKAKEVYDVTGAGDTVIAALGLSIAAGASIEKAAHIANHAAGITVGKVGTTSVTIGELKEAIEDDDE